MKKLMILSLILVGLSGCSVWKFWTDVEDKNVYKGPSCPEVPECTIESHVLKPEDMRCLAKQKQSYKACIKLHEESWEFFNK